MKKRHLMTTLIMVFLVVFAGISCAAKTNTGPTNSPTSARSNETASTNPETAIQARLEGMKKAWKERDTETYLSFFTDDAKIMTGGADQIWVGKKEYEKKYLLPGMKKVSFMYTGFKITKIDGNRASIQFIMHPSSRSGFVTFSQVWVNVGGNWLLKKSEYAI